MIPKEEAVVETVRIKKKRAKCKAKKARSSETAASSVPLKIKQEDSNPEVNAEGL